MKKAINKVINIILDIIIFFVFIGFLIALASFIQIKLMHRKYCNVFGYTYFQILTGSMENEINIDDVVIVKLGNKVKKGDIISYNSGDVIVTHRIVEINDEEIITKGDANNANDEPIKKNEVIGKVIYVGKRFGRIKKVITEPVVLVSLLSTIVLFGVYFSTREE
jgi:signal peptidase